MKDVNGWLMALAFLLGMVLTFAMMIRRVTREVPVTLSASAGLGGKLDMPDLGKVAGTVTAAGSAVASGAAAKLSGAAEKVGDLAEQAGDKIGAAADAVGDKIDSILEREPHGAGSVRLAARKDAPAGYTVKFDAETKRYYLPGTPGYEELETEWWFVDESSAKAAGFSRWDEIKDKVGDFFDKVGDKVGAAADAVGDKVGAAADAVGDKVGAAADAVGDKVGAAADAVGDKVDDVKDAASAKFAEAKDAVGDAKDAVADTAHAVGDAVGDKAHAAGAAVAAGVAGLASIDDVPAGPYGKGSSKANDDGSGPTGWLIKGNADSMLYHPPDSPAYEQTIAEVWFFDEESARAAGFDKWDKNFR